MSVAALLWLLATVLPGAAAIRVLWPAAGIGGTLAGAAPVTFGFAYAVGLAASRLSLDPVGAVLVGSTAVVVLAVVMEVRRGRHRSTTTVRSAALADRLRSALRGRTTGELVSLLLLGGGILLGVLLWHAFQSSMLVPVGWDAMHHGYFIRQISRFHTLDPAVVLASWPSLHDGGSTFYPLAFDLLTAVLHRLSGVDVSTLMLGSTVALGGVLLPIGAFVLARRLAPTEPLVAGFAAITSVLPLMQYLFTSTGRVTGPLAVALVPGVIVLLLPGREGVAWSRLPVAALGVVGLIGLHTSEAPTAVTAAALCALLTFPGGEGRGRHWFIWAFAVGAASLVVIVVLDPSVFSLVSQRHGAIVPPTRHSAGAALSTAASGVGRVWLLAVIGCAATLLPRWRAFRGLAAALLVFGLLYFLVARGTSGLVPSLAVPWYGDAGRIALDLTVIGAVPTAVGLAVVAGLVGDVGRSVARFVLGPGDGRRFLGWASPLVAGFAGVLVVVAFALPPTGREGHFVREMVGPVDRNSLAAFRFLAEHDPSRDPVLDDLRTDGALWMYDDDGVPSLFGNSPLLDAAPHSWLERLWLSQNLMSIGSDPCVRTLLDKYRVHFVYVGDARMADGWAHFSPKIMVRLPEFTQVFHQGHVHVFAVNPGSAPGRCDRDVAIGVPWGG